MSTPPALCLCQVCAKSVPSLTEKLIVDCTDSQAEGNALPIPATAFNLAIKDGPASGQPVPHLHVHVAPRSPDDLSPDKIYALIDRWSPAGEPNAPPPFEIPSDDLRPARTEASMGEESRRYGTLIRGLDDVTGAAAALDAPVQFGKFSLTPAQVFYVSASGGTYATVNLKPLCPGHVLVIPKRVVPTLAELSQAEHDELWQTVREVQAIVLKAYSLRSTMIGVQDGRDAGQSVPHVHVHVLPR